jgi:hypothetical protein
MTLAPTRCATGGAGLLNHTVAGCLLRNHDLLRAGEDRLPLGQAQAEGRVRQFLAFKGGHLRHNCGPIPWLDHELHRELHAHTSDPDACN